MNTVRVFFAIRSPKSIDEPLRRILERAREVFPKQTLRWIDLEHLHCTLQFINAISQEQIAVLIECATTLVKNQPSFWLHLGPLEWFPSLEHPKILSLSVEPQETLKRLSESLNQILVKLGCSVESRPFHGHMSMGRVLKHNLPKDGIKQIKNATLSPVLIDKIYLIESRPAQGARLYCTLAEFNLA
ncbi:MAG: RNA 2',3'-cyclic phosphodiesterase [Legionella sp.]|uniref:RNA 2',3'-cyclic phosphodiesterase n=1 Tax=Legionella sp. TaxID=459 RepID=UPI003D14E4D0